MRVGPILFLSTLLLGLAVGIQWQTQATRSPISTRYGADLAESATAMQREQNELKAQIADVRSRLDAVQSQAATLDDRTAALTERIVSLRAASGLTPLTGEGAVVTLDDGRLPASAPRRAIELAIVHSQDITDVFNAAWKAGALGIAVNGERVTSATACVGSTIQINGRLMSPPFIVSILGPADRIIRALADADALRDLKRRGELYGLKLAVASASDMALPAYDGPIPVKQATPTE